MIEMAALHKQDQSRVEPRLLLGTRSAQYGGIFVVNTHAAEDFKAAKPTLHIIIPTTGPLLLGLSSLCGGLTNVVDDVRRSNAQVFTALLSSCRAEDPVQDDQVPGVAAVL